MPISGLQPTSNCTHCLVSVARDIEVAKLLRWDSVTYLHVKFALHQVRQAVESTHGQHKQWKTDSRERTGSLCHVTNGICRTVIVDRAALTRIAIQPQVPPKCPCNIELILAEL